MIQTGLGFSSTRSTKSTQAAERKSKQIKKLLHLLRSQQKSFDATLTSFAYLVGDPVVRSSRGKKKKNNVSASNSSHSSSDLSPTRA
jgi:hypothetical protein